MLDTVRTESPVTAPAAEWLVASTPVGYPEAVAEMEARVAAIVEGNAPERVWLVEHPPLYTAGTSASPSDLILPDRFPVYRTGRGGQYTYHGPGQRVAYLMLDLNRRGPDLRKYVKALEEWIIRSLAAFGIAGERREGLIGVWVATSRRLREDRGDRHQGAALGELPRHRPQRRSRP